MLNFVILWEALVFSRVFNFVKNTQFCHFQRGTCIFSLFSILSIMVHFVIFGKWTSNYEICTHYVLWYIKTFLSKILNFVILKRPIYFFRFFNFVINAQFCHFLRGLCMFFHVWNFGKNAQFCHFVRGPWIFSLLQFCQKCSIVSFLWEARVFFRIFKFVKNAQFLSFCERTVDFFDSSILSEMLNFVIFREARGFFSLFQFCQELSILSLVKSGLQIMR